MLHEDVVVSTAAEQGGDGVFAARDMAAGTVVWRRCYSDEADTAVYSRREVFGAGADAEQLARYSRMLGHDRYASVRRAATAVAAWRLFNHSCDGNCWFLDDEATALCTRRAVSAGEQLTYDYALTETEASFHAGMRCRCGSERCRGELLFDDYRNPEFVAEFVASGRASRFVAQRSAELGWHHPSVYAAAVALEGSCGGLGLFTLRPLAAGTVVVYFGGKVVAGDAFDAVQRLRPTKHFLRVAPGLWMVPPHQQHPAETGDYINHSCEPNCGMLDSATVAAMRNVAAGEQLCIDYAMVMMGCEGGGSAVADALETFECACGAPSCRGVVRPTDHLDPRLRAKYEGFFPFFSRQK